MFELGPLTNLAENIHIGPCSMSRFFTPPIGVPYLHFVEFLQDSRAHSAWHLVGIIEIERHRSQKQYSGHQNIECNKIRATLNRVANLVTEIHDFGYLPSTKIILFFILDSRTYIIEQE